jgi:hypothetical protein
VINPLPASTKEQFLGKVQQLLESGRSRVADAAVEKDALAAAEQLMQQGEKTAELASHLLDILLALRKPVAGPKTASAQEGRKRSAKQDAEARYARILAASEKHKIDLHSPNAVQLIDQRLREDGGDPIPQRTLYSDLEHLERLDNLIIWTAQKLKIDPRTTDLNDSVERVWIDLRKRRHDIRPSTIVNALRFWAVLVEQQRLEHEAGMDVELEDGIDGSRARQDQSFDEYAAAVERSEKEERDPE